ncbi:hypothetical protein AB0L63_26920 [Nocardia sp. NPDC051990]|uniref:hypothetical protein n=1 Tax=Nocardia sp. NPDC051990 TaxID=3155285 RepID=UPI00341B814F
MFVHNDRLVDALHNQAHAAMLHDPGARAYYQELRSREMNHNAALRQLGPDHPLARIPVFLTLTDQVAD